MKKLVQFLPILAVGFMSCSTPDNEECCGGFISQHYINTYIDVEELKCEKTLYSDIHIGIWLVGNMISAPENKFQELSVKYGDTNYNKRIPEPGSHPALSDEFAAIEVVSDHDFDADHPAGRSLADVITFLGNSSYRFIQSGYTEKYDWTKAPNEYRTIFLTPDGEGSWPIEKPLNKLQHEDLVLLGMRAFLRFDSLPTLEKEHTLTITFRNNEKTVTGTASMTF